MPRLLATALLFGVLLLALSVCQAAPSQNLLAAKLGGKVVSFTSQFYMPEIGEDWSASNLIDGGTITKGWSSESATFPQEIVFVFNDEIENVIQAAMLDPRTADPPALGRGVKDFEIQIATELDGPWTRVGVFTMTETQRPQVFTFSPVKARYVKLRILSNQGSTSMVELGEFGVYHSAEDMTAPASSNTGGTGAQLVPGDVAGRLDDLINRLQALIDELRLLRIQYKVGDEALGAQLDDIETLASALVNP